MENDEIFHINLFGSPSLSWRGQPFALARRQARALLYYLANNPSSISRDKLFSLFWPDKPERKARRNLTRLVSYLGKELPHTDIIAAARDSLQLNPDLVRVDARQFVRLCAADAPGEEAVALYRGPFLIGFSLGSSPDFDFWLTEEGRRYEALFLQTLAGLVREKTEQRAFAAAIGYAERYLAVDALAEEIHRRLIALYAASGDRTAALKQYEVCVEMLERELGVSPLPETRAAYEAARSSKPVSSQVPPLSPVWTVLPSLDLPLIGREAAWEALSTAYRQKHAGGMILISGEAGVGKTRLMQEFATRETRFVLTGNNHPSTQALPYHPLVQMLRQALSQIRHWRAIPPLWLGELTPLLPELRNHFPDLPKPLAVEPQQAQSRLHQALTRVLLGLAASDAPLLLCLDDLHWADNATLDWLSAVSLRLANSHVCLVGTFRKEESASMRELRRAFSRVGLLEEVELGGLTPHAIDDILARVPGDTSAHESLSNHLAQTTGGNTFFVLEVVRALLEGGGLDTAPARLPLPGTVQDAIQTRLSRLQPITRQILEAAAVLSPVMEPALLWATAGRTELETADGLDELVQRQILQEGKDGLAFRHDLLRNSVYQTLNPWRRQALHRRAGEVLGEVYARRPETVAAQRAQHYDAAGAYELAVDSYELAVWAAQAVYAHEEAIRHLRRAIALLPEIEAHAELPARLHELLGKNLEDVGRFEAAREVFQQAIGFYSQEDTISLARLYWHIGRTLMKQLINDEANILLEKALATLGEQPDQDDTAWRQIWLDIQMTRLTLFFQIFDIEQQDIQVREMAPIVERTDSLAIKIKFNQSIFQLNLLKERYNPSLETLTIVKHNLEMALATQNPSTIAWQHFALGFGLFHAGEFTSSERYFLESLTLTRQIDDRLNEARALAFLSSLYRQMGDLDRTEKYAKLAGEKGRAVGNRHYVAHSLASLAWLANQNGEVDIALEKAQMATRNFLSAKIPFAWLALVILLAAYLDKEDLDQAVEAAAALLDPLQKRLPDDLTTALEGAVNNWESQDVEKTREFLEQAVKLSRERGYL